MSQTYEMEATDPFTLPVDPTQIPYGPRAKMAFDMRVAGAPYDVIADKLGYASGDTARQAILQRINKHFKQSEEDVAEIVEMELRRLDELQLICWRRAKDGDLAAVDRILRIMERRAKMLGYDQEQASTIQGDVTNNTAIVIAGDEEQYKAALAKARQLVQTNGDAA